MGQILKGNGSSGTILIYEPSDLFHAAFVSGMIASIEGFGVQGSAESLGRQVTSSVVKGIFMVIVVDGLFAMFFATINY